MRLTCIGRGGIWLERIKGGGWRAAESALATRRRANRSLKGTPPRRRVGRVGAALATVVERRLPFCSGHLCNDGQCWARRHAVTGRPPAAEDRIGQPPASVEPLVVALVAGYPQEAHRISVPCDAVRLPHQHVRRPRSFRIAMDDLPKAYHRRRALQRRYASLRDGHSPTLFRTHTGGLDKPRSTTADEEGPPDEHHHLRLRNPRLRALATEIHPMPRFGATTYRCHPHHAQGPHQPGRRRRIRSPQPPTSDPEGASAPFPPPSATGSAAGSESPTTSTPADPPVLVTPGHRSPGADDVLPSAPGFRSSYVGSLPNSPYFCR